VTTAAVHVDRHGQTIRREELCKFDADGLKRDWGTAAEIPAEQLIAPRQNRPTLHDLRSPATQTSAA